MPRLDLLTENTPGGSEYVDNIPSAPTAGQWQNPGRRPAKRNRAWEKAHRPYRYVNVPLELREQVAALAEQLVVTADDVARAFLEYGLNCLEDKTLKLHSRPNPRGRKMTLFPRDQAPGWREASATSVEPPTQRKKKASGEKKVYPAVSYRLPASLHSQLCGVAVEFEAPLGEVVTLFLQHSLNAYRKGNLALQPYPVAVRMTLTGSEQ